MESLGLYLHIPFCRSKCAYCDFYSLPGQEDIFDAYTERLCRRLAETAPQAEEYCVDTVYLGGGTPSLLGPVRLTRILEQVACRYTLAEQPEVTVEANPDSARPELLRTLRRAGVNRLSLGVQTADDRLLKRLGRPHTFRQAQQAVADARAAGFDNLSLDLMYGLPGETMDGLLEGLETVLQLAPEHLSVYGLRVEPGTPLAEQIDQGTARLPSEEEQADRYLAVCHRLGEAGFRHYEISNFAWPGRASRHNLRYWQLRPYLGFGPGAHSDFGGRRFAWSRDLAAFLTGREEKSEDAAIGPEERRREEVLLLLRTDRGIPRNRVPAGLETALIQAGLARLEENRLILTDQGFLVSNSIILRILEGDPRSPAGTP